jgi:hypothetical protein
VPNDFISTFEGNDIFWGIRQGGYLEPFTLNELRTESETKRRLSKSKIAVMLFRDRMRNNPESMNQIVITSDVASSNRISYHHGSQS